MKKELNNIGKVAFIIFVLFFGIFIGYNLKYGDIPFLEGYTYAVDVDENGNYIFDDATSSDATSSNATSSDATSSNATSSNATSSNATSSNATSSNATSSDTYYTEDLVFLDSFKVRDVSKEYYPGDKVYADYSVSGCNITEMRVVLEDQTDNSITYSISMMHDENGTYFVIPNNVLKSYYKVRDVLLVAYNDVYDYTFTKLYSNYYPEGNYFEPSEKFLVGIKENIKPVENISITGIKLAKENAKIGDKVYLTLNKTGNLKNANIIFTDGKTDFTIGINNVNNNPYIDIPSTMVPGNYSIKSVNAQSDNQTVILDNNINVNLKIEDNNIGNKYVISSDKIDDTVISNIYKLEDNSEIIVDANSNSIVSEKLFSTIKGTNKKVIINNGDVTYKISGKDVKTAKSIDVSYEIIDVSEIDSIYNNIKTGIIIDFADNGDLPGNMTITLQTKAINNNVNVYYYDSENDTYYEIKSNLEKDNNTYEFSINHTSKYVITNEKLPDNLITSNEKTESFVRTNSVYVLIIIASIMFISLVIVIIVIVKKKKNKLD